MSPALLQELMRKHEARTFTTVDLSDCALVRHDGRGPVAHTVYAKPDGARVLVVSGKRGDRTT